MQETAPKGTSCHVRLSLHTDDYNLYHETQKLSLSICKKVDILYNRSAGVNATGYGTERRKAEEP
jgi:hypothetical protein